MRSVAEIMYRLEKVEEMIAQHKAEHKRVGGGQYTIAAVLRWVLRREEGAMTCGLYPREGHKTHICIHCTEMWRDCPGCVRGKSCNFKPASPEILKKRDELFSSKKAVA